MKFLLTAVLLLVSEPCFSQNVQLGVGEVSALTATIQNIDARKPTLQDMIELRAKAEYAVYHTKSDVPKKYQDALINAAGELDVKIFSLPKDVYDSVGPVQEGAILAPQQKYIKLKDVPDLSEHMIVLSNDGCRWGVDYIYTKANNSIEIKTPACAGAGKTLAIVYRKSQDVKALKAKYGAEIPLSTLDSLEALSRLARSSDNEVSCSRVDGPDRRVEVLLRSKGQTRGSTSFFRGKQAMESAEKFVCGGVAGFQRTDAVPAVEKGTHNGGAADADSSYK